MLDVLTQLMDVMKRLLADQLGFSVVLGVVLVSLILLMVAYCIYYERKISAWIQDRYGPNRVGPVGLLQPIADGLKMFLKEDFLPGWVNRPLFVLAPALLFVVSLIGFAVIPWAGRVHWPWMEPDRTVDVQIASVDIGLLYILGVSGLSVYGIVLGAWASNSKYPFYGGIRSAAQMLSYEVPLGLSILVIVLTAGTLRLEGILAGQAKMWHVGSLPVLPAWNIFLHPLAFLLMLTCVFAETSRAPFDLAEAEQELVGGYHTEYSSMKFGMFFMGEYAHMITASALVAVLFLGGWHAPWLDRWLGSEAVSVWAMLGRFAVTFAKVIAMLFFYMWVRWTLPRFRFDQLMRIAWLGLVPMGMAAVGWTAVLTLWDMQRSWLAPVGEIVIVAAAMGIAATSKTAVTGRQTDLPMPSVAS